MMMPEIVQQNWCNDDCGDDYDNVDDDGTDGNGDDGGGDNDEVMLHFVRSWWCSGQVLLQQGLETRLQLKRMYLVVSIVWQFSFTTAVIFAM